MLKKINQQNIAQFLRYLIAGGTATAIDFIVLYIFVEFLSIWYILAATFSFIIALTISFFLNKFWTFKNGDKKISSQMVKFLIVNLIGLGINLIILYILVEFFFLWYLFAKVFATAVAVIWNFLGMRNLVFNNSEKNESNTP